MRQLRFICFEYVYEHVNLDFKIVLRYDFYACVNDTLQWAPWQLKHANQMRLLFIYINFDLLILRQLKGVHCIQIGYYNNTIFNKIN